MDRYDPYRLASDLNLEPAGPIPVADLEALGRGELPDHITDGMLMRVKHRCQMALMELPRAFTHPRKSLQRAAADVASKYCREGNTHVLRQALAFATWDDLWTMSAAIPHGQRSQERDRRLRIEAAAEQVSKLAGGLELAEAFLALKAAAAAALEQHDYRESIEQDRRSAELATLRREREQREELEMRELARLRVERRLSGGA